MAGEKTIVVTDSGFGGLSVMADLVERLKKGSPSPQVRVAFFNAHAAIGRGYNDIKDVGQKIRIFNNALEAMRDRYRPEAILIACNTLSVLYDRTPFCRQKEIDVLSIVDTSVDLILKNLERNPSADVVLLGTGTTIGSGVYPERLVAKGVSADRLFTEACSRVHVEIEKGPDGPATRELIRFHVGSVMKKVKERARPMIVSLNCTHYGYSAPLFEAAFREGGVRSLTLLNPNDHMADSLMGEVSCQNPQLSLEVVSQTQVSPEQMESLLPLIRSLSPQTAEAFRRYQHLPLFSY